jgi:hypothetical protein
MSLDVDAMIEAVATIERRYGISILRGPLYRWIASSYLRTGQKAQWLKYLSLAATRGDVREVAGDIGIAVKWRVHRMLRRPKPALTDLPNPDWTTQAQQWLDELRSRLDPA